ncbi:MAG TPA: hypothetical protein DF383_02330 [Deltaproteobacteria bacterium]|nr:hypothetical protein [Deltaproteobacteria bacterium]
MKKYLSFIFSLGSLILFLTLPGCGQGGTEIGNPGLPIPGDVPSPGNPGFGPTELNPSPSPTPGTKKLDASDEKFLNLNGNPEEFSNENE